MNRTGNNADNENSITQEQLEGLIKGYQQWEGSYENTHKLENSTKVQSEVSSTTEEEPSHAVSWFKVKIHLTNEFSKNFLSNFDLH